MIGRALHELIGLDELTMLEENRVVAAKGMLPTLFCLPYWLGYAPLTFTSAGPVGGVLYPWLLQTLRGLPWTSAGFITPGEMPASARPLTFSRS